MSTNWQTPLAALQAAIASSPYADAEGASLATQVQATGAAYQAALAAAGIGVASSSPLGSQPVAPSSAQPSPQQLFHACRFLVLSTGLSLPTYAAYIAGPQTTIAAGSDGATLPQAIINVASITGLLPAFPASGRLAVVSTNGSQIVTYGGTSSTTFTGCAGGTGTIHTGGAVSWADYPSPGAPFGTTGLASNQSLAELLASEVPWTQAFVAANQANGPLPASASAFMSEEFTPLVGAAKLWSAYLLAYAAWATPPPLRPGVNELSSSDPTLVAVLAAIANATTYTSYLTSP